MSEIDTVDEAVFATDVSAVFQAVVDEAAGRAKWWSPTVEIRPTSGLGEVGSTIEIRVRRKPRVRFSAQVVEKVEARLLRLRYIGGDFLGEGQWTFEPVDCGTRVRFRWHVRPHSLRGRLAARFRDIGAVHARVVRDGFRGLRRYLSERAGRRNAPANASRPGGEPLPAPH